MAEVSCHFFCRSIPSILRLSAFISYFCRAAAGTGVAGVSAGASDGYAARVPSVRPHDSKIYCRMRGKVIFALLLAIVVSAGELSASGDGGASAGRPVKMKEVWMAYDAFNAVYLDAAKYIYKSDSSVPAAVDRFNGAAAIWCQPIYWDMAMNAAALAGRCGERRRAKEYAELCRRIFDGERAHYADFDFEDNNENTGWFIYDDIMWWTISLARAYCMFGDEEYLRLAERSFSRVWYGSERVGDTGSYDEAAGGMFWRWYPISSPEPNRSGDGKMACINFPTVVAALTLSGCVPDGRRAEDGDRPVTHTRERYFEMGREIYGWGVENLFDAATGRVADSRHGDGEPDWKTHVYNQGTFIGASVLLYRATGERRYLDNAVAAADYVVEEMSRDGILPFEDGIEQGIYTAIFAQYMAMLVYDCGQRQYLPFLRRNIAAGWSNRDRVRNICGGEYGRPLDAGETVDSYSASGIPALMLLFATER